MKALSENPGSRIRKSIMLSIFTAIGTVINYFELLIPFSLPFLKPGLANAVTLIVLRKFGVKSALAVLSARILLSSFITGTFLTPVFFLSAAGGASSFAAMALLSSIFRGRLNVLTLSLYGAVAHNYAQLAALYFLFIHNRAVFFNIPALSLFGVAAGLATGLAAHAVERSLDKRSLLLAA